MGVGNRNKNFLIENLPALKLSIQSNVFESWVRKPTSGAKLTLSIFLLLICKIELRRFYTVRKFSVIKQKKQINL